MDTKPRTRSGKQFWMPDDIYIYIREQQRVRESHGDTLRRLLKIPNPKVK